jgi:hypothetical protein
MTGVNRQMEIQKESNYYDLLLTEEPPAMFLNLALKKL